MPEHSSLLLIPASEKPLPSRREVFVSDEGLESVSLQIMEGNISLVIHATRLGINPDILEKLVAGEIIRTPHADLPVCDVAGRLRMLWGYRSEMIEHSFVELLPDADVSPCLAFNDWLNLRYPLSISYRGTDLSEDWRILLLQMWSEETNPSFTIAPNDDLLMDAVYFNMDDLVEAILLLQPKIGAAPRSQITSHENALHLAMVNTRDYPVGCKDLTEISFANSDGEHWDDSHETSDWKFSARRIVRLLKAAGAVDFRPLLAACRMGDIQEVERMLECGYPPNFGTHSRTTPLLEAVQGGHLAVCEALLRHGADPDLNQSVDEYQLREDLAHPLKAALDHPEIFKLLISSGVDPATCDKHGRPLVFRGHYLSRKHVETIFGLVEFGALRGTYHRTGVHFLDAQDLALCWDFVPHELVDQMDLTSMTPLLDAIRYGDTAKALFLLAHGADPLRTSVACMHQALDIAPPHFRLSESLQHLLGWSMGRIDTIPEEKPGNPDEMPTMIITPIQMALLRQNIEIVDKLLDMGAIPDPNVIAVYPFRDAVRNAKEEILARIAEEPEHVPQVKVDCTNAPEDLQEWAQLACRVTNVLLHDPTKTTRYPEMVEELDLLRWADYECHNPAFVEPFRSGRN